MAVQAAATKLADSSGQGVQLGLVVAVAPPCGQVGSLEDIALACRLALLPLAVLMPDGPPAAGFLAGRVHRDAVFQLDDLTPSPSSRATGPAREDPARCRAPRPSPGWRAKRPHGGLVVGILRGT